MEEGKGEDGDKEKGCRALTMWESGWRNVSAVVISLSHRCERDSLSGEIRKAPAPT